MTATVREHPKPATESIEDAIELLSDGYACQILAALEKEPMPAVELAGTCDISRATVYRRLNRLEDLGFVSSQLTYNPDGHHRKQFRLVLDEVRIEIDEDGVSGRVAVSDVTSD